MEGWQTIRQQKRKRMDPSVERHLASALARERDHTRSSKGLLPETPSSTAHVLPPQELGREPRGLAVTDGDPQQMMSGATHVLPPQTLGREPRGLVDNPQKQVNDAAHVLPPQALGREPRGLADNAQQLVSNTARVDLPRMMGKQPPGYAVASREDDEATRLSRGNTLDTSVRNAQQNVQRILLADAKGQDTRSSPAPAENQLPRSAVTNDGALDAQLYDLRPLAEILKEFEDEPLNTIDFKELERQRTPKSKALSSTAEARTFRRKAQLFRCHTAAQCPLRH
jgi:hypothetical protein